VVWRRKEDLFLLLFIPTSYLLSFLLMSWRRVSHPSNPSSSSISKRLMESRFKPGNQSSSAASSKSSLLDPRSWPDRPFLLYLSPSLSPLPSSSGPIPIHQKDSNGNLIPIPFESDLFKGEAVIRCVIFLLID